MAIESGHKCEFCTSQNAVVSALITGKLQYQYACNDCAVVNFKDKTINSVYRWVFVSSLNPVKNWHKVI